MSYCSLVNRAVCDLRSDLFLCSSKISYVFDLCFKERNFLFLRVCVCV